MILSLFGITLFNYLDLNTLMIATMVLFLCFYEFGIGSIVFIHIFETNVDSITGVANQVLFFMVFTTSLITPTLIANLTVSGTFAFFGALSSLSLLYFTFFIKHTSYYEKNKDGNMEEVKLTEKQKKELYWPEEYRNQTAK